MSADRRQPTADSQWIAIAIGAALAVTACRPNRSEKPSPFPTVATVNGVALTRADLDAVLQAPGGHAAGEPTADRQKKALETLIRDELVRQRAQELGLWPNAQHEEELARLSARLTAVHRRAMADAFYKHEVEGQVAVSEAEARRLFDENAAKLRTELKLNQLLFRDEAQAAQAVAALEAGESFEAVARRQFEQLPEGAGKPWELGFLSWRQMPSQWRPVIFALAAGQSTGIVRGPNHRFWVLQVVDRRENAGLTFEEVKADLTAELKAAQLETRAAQLEKELRSRARITIDLPAPTVAQAPPGVP